MNTINTNPTEGVSTETSVNEKLQMIRTKLEKFKTDVIQMEKKREEHCEIWEQKFSEHSPSEPYYSSYSSYDGVNDEFENLKSWWETNFDIVSSWKNHPRFKNDDLLKIIDDVLDVVIEKETSKN